MHAQTLPNTLFLTICLFLRLSEKIRIQNRPISGWHVHYFGTWRGTLSGGGSNADLGRVFCSACVGVAISVPIRSGVGVSLFCMCLDCGCSVDWFGFLALSFSSAATSPLLLRVLTVSSHVCDFWSARSVPPPSCFLDIVSLDGSCFFLSFFFPFLLFSARYK